MGGGIDCIGLVQEIYVAGRRDRQIRFCPCFRRLPVALRWATRSWTGCAGRWTIRRVKPRGNPLELEIPEDFKDPQAATPRDFFKPGDILVMKHGSLFHMPLIYDDDLHFVNAIPRRGVTEGTIQDTTSTQHRTW